MSTDGDADHSSLEQKLGTLASDGSRATVTLRLIVDEPRDAATDRTVLSLLETHDEVLLDFEACEKVDSAWLRLLKRLSAEGESQGVKVSWRAVAPIVRQTADMLAIAEGIEFVDETTGD